MRLKEVLFAMLSKSPGDMIRDRISFLRQTKVLLTEDRAVSEIVDRIILEKLPAAILCKMQSPSLVGFMQKLEDLVEAGGTDYELEAFIDSTQWIPFYSFRGTDDWLQNHRVKMNQSEETNIIAFPNNKN
ncbi:hypothetical protein KP05_03700 [Cobetia amphilecti]|nr:hypothetical protein KP05_03700 [Cobetia amphilecti]